MKWKNIMYKKVSYNLWKQRIECLKCEQHKPLYKCQNCYKLFCKNCLNEKEKYNNDLNFDEILAYCSKCINYV